MIPIVLVSVQFPNPMSFSPSPQHIQSLYTDGACLGNPGPGGWATVVFFSDGTIHELGGAEAQTTNNRMELQGAIAALELLLKTGQTETTVLYTDSEYVKKGITQWIQGWKRKGWKTSQGKDVLNQDLWQRLDTLMGLVNQQLASTLRWEYVRGHSGNPGNERCDTIARGFAQGQAPQLRQSPSLIPQLPPKFQKTEKFDSNGTDRGGYITIQSMSENFIANPQEDLNVMEATLQSSTELNLIPNHENHDGSETLPREPRVIQLRHLVETLRIADEIASQGYLITSSELADLMDVNASAVTSRGDNWVWRNWVVSRVRREGNQILWQLERVD